MAGKHQVTNASHLRALIASEIQPDEMAEMFGVSVSAISRWLKNDQAPLWSVAASKAFSTNSTKVLIIGVIDNKKWAAAEAAFKALGLEKIGQRNL